MGYPVHLLIYFLPVTNDRLWKKISEEFHVFCWRWNWQPIPHPAKPYTFSHNLWGHTERQKILLTGLGSGAHSHDQCADPGLGAFLTPGSGMGESQHPDPGSEMNNPDHIFLSLETIFLLFLELNYLNSLRWRQFGSGIRDGKKSDPGSGINIPDPPHCIWQ